jgi:hypothetical protein
MGSHSKSETGSLYATAAFREINRFAMEPTGMPLSAWHGQKGWPNRFLFWKYCLDQTNDP